MTKRLVAWCAALLLLVTAVCCPMTAAAAYPLPENVSISAQSAMVVFLGTDMEDDMLMYEKNADDRIAPAGMVRIMVGLYALKTMEEQNIDPAVATGTYTIELFEEFAGTGLYTVGMDFGDVWHVEDLLGVSVIHTAADAVAVLAAALAGTTDRFVEGMNALAKEIGCENTHFANVYGLDDPEQYSSARDMYRILRYATLTYPEMITLLSRSQYSAEPVKGEGDTWPTMNEMMRPNSAFYYTPLVYGRSGYTESAGQSCASVARDDGFEFMTVVMGCRDEEGTDGLAFTDTMTLFRWVYNAFSYKTIVSKGQPVSRIGLKLAWSTDSVALVAKESLEGMLRNDLDVNTLRYDITHNTETLVAPVDTETVYGTAKIYDGDELVGTVELCASQAIDKSGLLGIFDAVWSVLTSPAMLIVFALLVSMLIGYILLSYIHNHTQKKNNRKRVKRYK